MSITITPTSPVVQSVTTSKTINSFVVTEVDYDISENKLTTYYDMTLSTGVIESDTVVITGTDATTLLATAATAGQTLAALIVQAVTTAISTSLSFTVGSVSQS